MAEKEIRNVSHIELPTDLKTKEGKQVVILPHAKLDTSNIDEKSLKASLENGRLKNYVDRKFIVQGTMITGDAKKIEKLDAAEGKKIEAKVEKKKKKDK